MISENSFDNLFRLLQIFLLNLDEFIIMAISSAEIQKRVKITNLFRLGKRLEYNEINKELFLQFEKNYSDIKDSLSSLDRKLLEENLERLKKKYSITNQSEAEQLFGVIFR